MVKNENKLTETFIKKQRLTINNEEFKEMVCMLMQNMVENEAINDRVRMDYFEKYYDKEVCKID
jgi:hypothetical protein